MNNEEKPLSELIGSIEQKDFVPVEEQEINPPPKEKKSNTFMIVVLILLLLIAGMGGYYGYTQYFGDQEEGTEVVEEMNEEEARDEFDDQKESAYPYTVVPCEGIGENFEHDESLGDIKEILVGSWHECISVSAGYCSRFVFFATGNYIYFPSEYICDFNDEECLSSLPIEEGIWGVDGNNLNLAINGEQNNVRTLIVSEIRECLEDTCIYPFNANFDGVEYHFLSKDTNLWDLETGQQCIEER